MELAITQKKASPKMSDRYVQIDTEKVIDAMHDAGFTVSSVKVNKVRRRDPQFAKHMVIFENNKLKQLTDSKLRMIFTNSHNGTSGADMRLGLYRFVCSNGLVIGSDWARFRVRHVGENAKELHRGVEGLLHHADTIAENILEWQSVKLNRRQQLSFAEQALELRFGEQKKYNPEALLEVKRAEDKPDNVWTLFNRIQEHCSVGGLQGITENGRGVRSRKLDNIDGYLSFNESLWNLASNIASS